MARFATKQLTARYPLDHESGGLVRAVIQPGEEIPEEILADMSPSLIPKVSIDPEEELAAHDAEVAEASPDTSDNEPDDGLNDMTVAELRLIIADNSIEVQGGNKKANLIAAIRANREGEG